MEKLEKDRENFEKLKVKSLKEIDDCISKSEKLIMGIFKDRTELLRKDLAPSRNIKLMVKELLRLRSNKCLDFESNELRKKEKEIVDALYDYFKDL